MIFYPNAKINIGMSVGALRTDGYHNISTLMYPILGLHDIVQIEPSTSFSFAVDGYPVEPDCSNLVVKAYHIFCQQYHTPPVTIHLHKNIPLGAGLGGGSADATFTLMALAQLFSIHPSAANFNTMALQLGSDCPFFFNNSPQIATGRGEQLEKVHLDLTNYKILLLKPNESVSTTNAYHGIQTNQHPIDYHSLTHTPIEQWKDIVVNDFEKQVFPLVPRLHSIKQQLYDAGAIYASMTGSGSCMYALFPNDYNIPTLPTKDGDFIATYPL